MTGRVLSLMAMTVVAGTVLSACGGSNGASSPNTPSGPAPVQTTPSPDPTPSPSPTPTPQPGAGPSPSPSPTPNARPVAKTVIKIEYIDCPATGEVVHGGPFNWTSVGCRIHMDLTPRDGYNRPTYGAKGRPEWFFNDPSLVYARDDRTYTPVLRTEKPGNLLIQGELDGVKSNTIQIWLY